MSEKTGGPAFPTGERLGRDGRILEYQVEGMSLRDYFAGKELGKVDAVAVCDVPEAYDRLADHCYRMADAMLKARGA